MNIYMNIYIYEYVYIYIYIYINKDNIYTYKNNMGRFINCLDRQRTPGDWRRRGYIVLIDRYLINNNSLGYLADIWAPVPLRPQ